MSKDKANTTVLKILTQKPQPWMKTKINKNNRHKFISMRYMSTIIMKTMTQKHNLSLNTSPLLNLLLMNLLCIHHILKPIMQLIYR